MASVDVATLLQRLGELEWVQHDGSACPVCEEWFNHERKHGPTCWLGALLGRSRYTMQELEWRASGRTCRNCGASHPGPHRPRCPWLTVERDASGVPVDPPL